MSCISQQAHPVLKSVKPNYKKPAENWWLYCTLCQLFQPPSQKIPTRAGCRSQKDAHTNVCRSITEKEVTGSQQFKPGSNYKSCARERTGSGADGWSKPLTC